MIYFRSVADVATGALIEIKAGLADVRRTEHRKIRHLRLGDWGYKLGYLLGWTRRYR